MKNNKVILLIIVIAIILIVLITFKIINSKKEENIKRKCVPFTGGAFHLIFNTNSEESIDPMHVCIACSPDSYDELPIPVREGYTFDGWYYDKELKEKIEFTNTRFFTPVPEYDKNKCRIGYQDIEIYAKWHKE